MKKNLLICMMGMLFIPLGLFGQAWTKETLPEISRKYTLRGIHFASPNQGWAVGYDYDDVDFFKSKTKGIVLHYQDGNWSVVDIPGPSADWILAGVWFLSENEGWIYGTDRVAKLGLLMHYKDGNWEKVSLPAVDSKAWEIKDVFFVNEQLGYLVGGTNGKDGPVLMEYANGTWNTIQLPDVKKQTLLAVAGTDADHIFTGGHREGDLTYIGFGRAIGSYILHKKGNTWEPAQFPLLARNFTCMDLFCISAKNVYAAGLMTAVENTNPSMRTPETGKILQFDGKKWTEIKVDVGAKEWNYTGVAFANQDHGWIIGNYPARNKGLLVEYKKGKFTPLGKKLEPTVDGKWHLYGITYDGKGAYYAVGGERVSDKGIILKSVK